MTKMNPRRGARQTVLRTTPVAAAAAAVLCTGAWAQQATDAPSATVTITGIRRGIESAISTKKNAEGVVEAISAEDIGKLPDTTIAESLARLPGVTTQRTRTGQASTISIRGLGPDFNGYLLNGREQSGIGDSRAVDLSVYPAELIGGATVYKTSDASVVGSGLAGTIDNKLIDPLAFGGRVIAGSAQRDTTGKGLEVEGRGHRYSLSYIDQFADRKIGVALGYVRVDGTANQVESGGWGSATVTAQLAGGGTQTGVTVPGPFGGGLDYKNRRVKDDRDGFAAIVAFKPNKDFTSQLDLFWSKIDQYTKIARLAGGLGGGGLSTITNATLAGNTAIKGTYTLNPNIQGVDNHAHLIAQSEGIFDNDKISSLGLKNTWKFMPGWTGSLDLSSNKAKRVERDIEAYGSIGIADTLTFDTTNGSTPRLTPGNPANYTDPSIIKIRDETGWSGVANQPQAGYSKGPTTIDKISAIRLDLSTALPEGSMFTDLQFGANFTKRTKDRSTDEGLIVSTTNGGKDPINFPSGAYIENNVGGTGFNMLTFDPQVGLWPGATIQRKYNDDILSKSWVVEEKVSTLYAKSRIDTTLGGVPLSGNAGLQVVNTDQSSAGFRAGIGPGVVLTNPASGLTTDGKKFTDFLPSVNLQADLGAGNLVRFGASVQIARPTLTDMRNSFAAANDNTLNRYKGSAGNPQLKPFKAKALDLSYEKYFGNKGYFAVSGFFKKLDTYITTQTTANYNFAPYAQALGLAPNATNGFIGVFTQPTNGNGGNVSGLEFSASLPFGLILPALSGFGVVGSYADTHSSVSLPNLIGLNPNQEVPSGGKMTLPGLSKTNTKLMVYYEAGGFSAFVAENKRSTYIGSVANDQIGGYPTLKYIQGSTWLSAQIGYEFQDGPAKGLGLRFEGNNLNKPIYRQLNPDGSLDKEIKTGAAVAIKLSYKYQ
jgi:iron complex outermembrane recepter protein